MLPAQQKQKRERLEQEEKMRQSASQTLELNNQSQINKPVYQSNVYQEKTGLENQKFDWSKWEQKVDQRKNSPKFDQSQTKSHQNLENCDRDQLGTDKQLNLNQLLKKNSNNSHQKKDNEVNINQNLLSNQISGIDIQYEQINPDEYLKLIESQKQKLESKNFNSIKMKKVEEDNNSTFKNQQEVQVVQTNESQKKDDIELIPCEICQSLIQFENYGNHVQIHNQKTINLNDIENFAIYQEKDLLQEDIRRHLITGEQTFETGNLQPPIQTVIRRNQPRVNVDNNFGNLVNQEPSLNFYPNYNQNPNALSSIYQQSSNHNNYGRNIHDTVNRPFNYRAFQFNKNTQRPVVVQNRRIEADTDVFYPQYVNPIRRTVESNIDTSSTNLNGPYYSNNSINNIGYNNFGVSTQFVHPGPTYSYVNNNNNNNINGRGRGGGVGVSDTTNNARARNNSQNNRINLNNRNGINSNHLPFNQRHMIVPLDVLSFVLSQQESSNEMSLQEAEQQKGLTDQQINLFNKIKFDKEKSQSMTEDLQKCIICLNDFQDQEQLRLLICAHRFHVKCIDVWLNQNTTCPLCQKDTQEMIQDAQRLA